VKRRKLGKPRTGEGGRVIKIKTGRARGERGGLQSESKPGATSEKKKNGKRGPPAGKGKNVPGKNLEMSIRRAGKKNSALRFIREEKKKTLSKGGRKK